MIQISKDKLTIEIPAKFPVYEYVYLKYALQHVMKVATELSHHEDILEVFQLHSIHKLLMAMDFEVEQLEAMLNCISNPEEDKSLDKDKNKDKLIKSQFELIETLQRQLKKESELIEA